MIRRAALLAWKGTVRLFLPEHFRSAHGREMEELFSEALEAARRRGYLPWLYAVGRGLLDVTEQAVRMRAGSEGNRRTLNHRGEAIMDSLFQDVRFAIRSLSKSPGYSVLAVSILALGIGANTAIFSLVNSVLLRAPAHVENPGELVSIYTSDFSGGPPYGMNSLPDFEDFRQIDALEDAVSVAPGVVNVAGDDGVSQILVTEFVSGNYFDLLGVRPALGRTFTAEEDDHTSGAAVAVLSHGLWTRRFGADPGVVGMTLRASGQTLTIIGVAPEGFGGSLPLVTPELWLPDATAALIQGPGNHESRGRRGYLIRGRLNEGASVEQAQQQLNALSLQLHEEAPNNWTDVNQEVRRVGVFGNTTLPPNLQAAIQGFATLLLAVVTIVLLIACANIANLTLARASRRSREMAIRVSMGAGRGRVVRQLLSESAIIGVLGGALGALMAVYVMRLAETFRPITGVSISLDLGVDSVVLGFCTAVTLLTVLAVGLWPALKASRPDLVTDLKEGGSEGGGPFRWREMRNLLVVGQVSASLLLLVGAGLLLKSLRAAASVDPGFAVEGLATMSMGLGPEGYSTEEAMALFDRLTERTAALPGVTSVTTADALPMTILAGRRSGVAVPGYEPREGEDMEYQFHSVGPGFMQTMGMEILRGREFDARDAAEAELTIIVNETFANHHWPGEDPLGRLVVWGGQNEAQVVGLVADAMYRDLRDTGRDAFFLPLAQNPATSLTLVARTDPERTAATLASLREEVVAIDGTLPISSLQTMEDAISFTLLPQRIAGWLLTLSGGLGLLLAMVGLYGVMSSLVAQRTREVAVRMALGAKASQVVQMVVARGLVLSAVGVALGLGLAAGVTRFAEAVLFGVDPLDVGVFVLMAIAALMIAGFASWVPARRASRLDPMDTLRHD